jgi:transposase
MINRAKLTDEEWQEIYGILQLNERAYTGSEDSCRKFVNAVLWILRSGAQWRLLPMSLGKWNSVFKRFSRWCSHSVWNDLHKSCIRYPDLQSVFIDSTVVRAHACAAGAAGSTTEAEALGRSKGGYSTKIHAVTDGLGCPIDFTLTGGQSSDIGQAQALLELTPAGVQALMADKGYDCNAFVSAIESQGMTAVIPPKSNRVNPRQCDFFAYKERHLIECFFGKIKHYRRIFSRYEKKSQNYMGFIRFVSALIWLR